MSQEFVIDFTFQENTAWLVFLFTHIWVSSDLAQLTNTYPHKQMMKHGNLFINLSICLSISIYLSLSIYLPIWIHQNRFSEAKHFHLTFLFRLLPLQKRSFFSQGSLPFFGHSKNGTSAKTWWGSAALFQPLNKHTFHMESSVSQYTYYKVMILSVWQSNITQTPLPGSPRPNTEWSLGWSV